jgi:hypothetical protein
VKPPPLPVRNTGQPIPLPSRKLPATGRRIADHLRQ